MGYRSFRVAQGAVGPMVARTADTGPLYGSPVRYHLRRAVLGCGVEFMQLALHYRKLALLAMMATHPMPTVQAE